MFDSTDADDLVESFPAFLVSTALAEALLAAGLTGYALAGVRCSLSVNAPGGEQRPPSFRWLKIVGRTNDDFSLGADHRLVVSESAFAVLARFRLDRCDITALA